MLFALIVWFFVVLLMFGIIWFSDKADRKKEQIPHEFNTDPHPPKNIDFETLVELHMGAPCDTCGIGIDGKRILKKSERCTICHGDASAYPALKICKDCHYKRWQQLRAEETSNSSYTKLNTFSSSKPYTVPNYVEARYGVYKLKIKYHSTLTVRNVWAEFRRNNIEIPVGAIAYWNGQSLSRDNYINPGDYIEFHKPTVKNSLKELEQVTSNFENKLKEIEAVSNKIKTTALREKLNIKRQEEILRVLKEADLWETPYTKRVKGTAAHGPR